MRRYRAPSRPLGAFCAGQSWADCITNTAGSDFRQGQVEEVVISKQVVEGTARPLYIYADRAADAGASA